MRHALTEERAKRSLQDRCRLDSRTRRKFDRFTARQSGAYNAPRQRRNVCHLNFSSFAALCYPPSQHTLIAMDWRPPQHVPVKAMGCRADAENILVGQQGSPPGCEQELSLFWPALPSLADIDFHRVGHRVAATSQRETLSDSLSRTVRPECSSPRHGDRSQI